MRSLHLIDGYSKVTPEKMLESIEDLHFLKFFVPEGPERTMLLPLYVSMLESPQQRRAKLLEKRVVGPASDEELNGIWTALEKYRSQLPLIFKDMEGFKNDSGQYSLREFAGWGYFERYWRLAKLPLDSCSGNRSSSNVLS
jgi:hypothetical protein